MRPTHAFRVPLDPTTLLPIRETVDLSPGDYGADPLGENMFRMVPSGRIVNEAEKDRVLALRRRRG